MSLPLALESLKAEALQTSCEAWALRSRWPLRRTGSEMVGPCPVCGGTDRFGINIRENLFQCRRCEIRGHGVIDLVMAVEGLDFTRACERITGRRAADPVDEQKMAQLREDAAAGDARRAAEEARHRTQAILRARKLLDGVVPFAAAADVQAYLAARGIMVPEALHADIRLGQIDAHPWVELQGRDWQQLHVGPAMIAAIRQPQGTVTAVHQTWLAIDADGRWGKLRLPDKEDGSERPAKKVLGSKKGGEIRLFTPRDSVRRMVIGEGVETTLTALAHNFEPETAYWTSVDLGNWAGRAARAGDGTVLHDEPFLEEPTPSGQDGQPVVDSFVLPDWVEEVVFLTDDDDARNHTEAKVVRGLKRALWRRDRDRAANPALPDLTCLYMPPLGGGRDLNDLVRVK